MNSSGKPIRDHYGREPYFKIAAKVVKAWRHHEYWRPVEIEYPIPHQKLP